MKFLFAVLSIAYIAGIFLFAGSPVVSTLSEFNPYSILHIPLYGILTVLLISSFIPELPNNLMTHCLAQGRNRPIDLPREIRSLFHWGQLPNDLMTRFFIAGFIALGVGIADEIHQAYVPGRDASIIDVLLDLVGIILTLFFISWLLKTKKSLTR